MIVSHGNTISYYFYLLSNLSKFTNFKIYPYISYAILAWSSTYSSHLKKVQIKQNLVGRLIFFVNTHGKDTESAFPLLNFLDLLTVYSVYSLHALKLPISGIKVRDTFLYAGDVHN